jgi:starvation-inducible DNA-binding protein
MVSKATKHTNLNPLDDATKQLAGETLLNLVADASALYGHVKTAHWNLRGSNFLGIHRLLDEVAATLLKGIDEIAERARQLGLNVDGNVGAIAKKSKLQDFPTGVVDGETVVKELGGSLGSVIDSMHEAIERTDEAGDAVTADLLTRTSGLLEVQLWLLESHVL